MMLRVVVAFCLVAAAVAGPPVTKLRSEIEEFRSFLENSRTAAGVRLKPSPYGSVWENSGKYQGDILLDDPQIEELVQQFATDRAAYIRPNTRWPGRVIPYEFAQFHFDQAQRNHILSVMRFLETRICIRFRARRFREYNYAEITGFSGCYATVGFASNRGPHTMNVAHNVPGRGCLHPVVIIHEWFHVIGFFHMQSAYNRYNYVRINWGNIQNGAQHNFYRMGANVLGMLGLPYEHQSCMHYARYAFSNNGRPTIEATRAHVGIMGQLDHVTGWDLLRVDRHYGCAAWRTEKDYEPLYFDKSFFPDIEGEYRTVADIPETQEVQEAKQEVLEAKEDVPEAQEVQEAKEEVLESIEEVPEALEEAPQALE